MCTLKLGVSYLCTYVYTTSNIDQIHFFQRNTIPSIVHPHAEVLFYSANISTFAEIPECQRTTLKIICIFGSNPIEVYENQIPTYGCKGR